MLHPGWDSHPLRHHSHRLVLQTEGKTNRNNTHTTMLESAELFHMVVGTSFRSKAAKDIIVYNILRVLFKKICIL